MDKLYIPIIFGGAIESRPSYTEKCALVSQEMIAGASVHTELVDARTDYQFSHANREADSPEAKKLGDIFSRADAFIIVSPEYNHGYPGDLKNLLDSFYKEYNRKPVGIIGVSSGGIGGARMVEQLRLVAVGVEMVPIKAVVHFSSVKTLFDDSGEFLEKEVYKKRFEKFIGELSWYAHALKNAREK